MLNQFTFFLLVFLFALLQGKAQEKSVIDSSYANNHYKQRLAFFKQMPDDKKEIIFLGNSITEAGEWQELIPGKSVKNKNRGIGGDNTFGVLARLSDVTTYKPKRIFLLIGINNIGRGLPIEVISNNYKRIIQQIKSESPRTKLFVQSVLPMNEKMLKAEYLKNKKDSVAKLNESIQAIAKVEGIEYINLHPVFADEQGGLKDIYTMDGLHLRPSAYVEWVAFLKRRKLL